MTSARSIILLVAFLLPAPAWAFYELESEEGDRTLEATGALRLSGAWLHLPDVELIYPNGDDGLAALVQRLLVSGDMHEKVGLQRLPAPQLPGSWAPAGWGTPGPCPPPE